MKTAALGIVLIVVFAVVLFVAIPNGIWVPQSLPDGAISPAAWPSVVSTGLILLGMVLVAQGLFEVKAMQGAPRQRAARADDALPAALAWGKIAGALMLLALYAWALHVLGIVLSSVIALPLFALLYGERRVVILAPLAILLPVGLYYFFTQVANIPMPTGIFG